jgi:hypothetical protein
VRTARRGGVLEVREALATIDRARSQAEILAALLREAAERFGARAAVILVRGGEMRGWAGQGFGDADAAIRDLSFAPAAGGGWARLSEGQSAVHLNAADSAELCSRIEAPLVHEGVLIPVVLRDRIAAGLYADSTAGLPPVEALQILAYAAAQAIELLPFRERPFTPTLTAEESLAAAPPAPPAATPEPVQPEPVRRPEAAPAPPAEPEPEPAAASFTTTHTAVVPEPEPEVVPEPEPEPEEIEIEPAPAAVAESVTEIEVEAEPELEALPELPDMDLSAPAEEPAAPSWPAPVAAPEPSAPPPSPATTVFQPLPLPDAPETLRSIAPEPSADLDHRMTATAPMPIPTLGPQASPDETVLLQRPNLRETPAPPAPAPPPLRPVPPPPPAPVPEPAGSEAGLSGIPEVKPPSGVEGPGWAFAASRTAVSPSEEAQHEEARRLARLLVSEIKLYNEEQVEEGRRRKDVYERLKEDIDRSRQMYEERVEPRILKSTDYFYQELVRILAAGDAKALGI